MAIIYAIEIIFRSHGPFQSYQLTCLPTFLAELAKPVIWYLTQKGLWDLKKKINEIYYHLHFYLKTGVKFLYDFFVLLGIKNLYEMFMSGKLIISKAYDKNVHKNI